MQWRNSSDRFGAFTQAFHWGMLALLTAVCLAIELKGLYPRGSAGRAAMTHWHELLGLTAALAVFARLCWRAFDAPPPDLPGTPVWQRRVATLTKLALYVLLVALPVTGLIAAVGRGNEVLFLGIDFNALIGPLGKDTGKTVKDVHEFMATAAYWLVGLHAAAALWHHFIRHDVTLRRMMPGREARR